MTLHFVKADALAFCPPLVQLGNAIGRVTPSGSFSERAIPTEGSLPARLTTGPDGNVWFTEFATDQIGRVVP